MLPHQPQDPLAADGQAAMGQPRPHLAVALPWNGVSCKTPRIAVSTSLSLTAVFGPRLLRAGAASRGAAVAYTLERATPHTWQSIVSG
jgi:hypothetical protein